MKSTDRLYVRTLTRGVAVIHVLFASAINAQVLNIDQSLLTTQIQRDSFAIVDSACAMNPIKLAAICALIIEQPRNPELPNFFGSLPPTTTFVGPDNAAIITRKGGGYFHTYLKRDSNSEDESQSDTREGDTRQVGTAEFFAGTHSTTGSFEGDTEQAGSEHDAWSLLAGVEYRVADGFNVIAAFGGGSVRSQPTVDNVDPIESDDRMIAFYGKLFKSSIGYVEAGLHLHETDHDFQRIITFEDEKALVDTSFSTDSQGVSLEFGRNRYVSGWSYGFHGRVMMNFIQSDQYNETSNESSLGLLVSNAIEIDPIKTTHIKVGGRVMRRIYTDSAILFPTLSFSVQSENDRDIRRINATNLLTNVETSYLGGNRNSSYQVIEAGMQAVIKNKIKVFGNYTKYIRNNVEDNQALRLGISLHF